MFDRLVTRFQRASIFRDIDSLPVGRPFPERLQESMSQAKVALVIIGPKWAAISDSEGNCRLDNPDDFVRLEVEQALASGKPVIPVLVSNASMPDVNQLPASLRPLVHQNGIQVRPDPDFHRDMDVLLEKLIENFGGIIAAGDLLTITIAPPLFDSPTIKMHVGQDGCIPLPFLEDEFKIAELSKARAAREIVQRYVDAQIYKKHMASVLVQRQMGAGLIRPGDLLTINIAPAVMFAIRGESSPIRVHVDEDGTVLLPYLEQLIVVANLTEAEAERAVAHAYVMAQILMRHRLAVCVERQIE